MKANPVWEVLNQYGVIRHGTLTKTKSQIMLCLEVELNSLVIFVDMRTDPLLRMKMKEI